MGFGVTSMKISVNVPKHLGTSQGLGGSMHIFSKEKGFYGGYKMSMRSI